MTTDTFTVNSRHNDDSTSQRIVDTERDVWVALDTMIRLMAQINHRLQIPVPTQILGLLLDDSTEGPQSFQLDQYAAKLSQSNAQIGTAPKSPFIRTCENWAYPPHRRAA
mmetsp:Transcript_8021/g.22289  ORF Transcript_8021/g.22289 Transcript_8021/m.22289 type:complete len:110 (+) Transcript_8021:508-837(+)